MSALDDQISPKPSGRAKNAGRLEEAVYAQLLDAIRAGKFTLGQRLPSENVLAAEYQVSRPVIRAALAKLRDDGLVTSQQGAGSFVGSGSLAAGGGFAPLGSVNDITSYYRFRSAIEASCAEGAASNATAEDVEALQRYAEEFEALGDEGAPTIESDFDFHFKIAKLSDNRFLFETLQMLRPHTAFVGKFRFSLEQASYREVKQSVAEEHRRIVQGIAAKDSAAARDAMIDHIRASERRVFQGR